MIPKLQNSKKFTDDYQQYQERIKKITDPKIQSELTSLLVQLKEQVMYIDRSHDSMFITGRVNGDLADQRATLISIKKNLDNKLSRVERTTQN